MLCRVATLCSLLLAAAPNGVAAYNSEEHKWVTDRAVAQLLQSVRPPSGTCDTCDVRLEERDISESIREAKTLAVGSATSGSLDKTQTGVQDNCYWRFFLQLKYNKNIWVPSQLAGPTLRIKTHVGSDTAYFSLGQLVALYGDYRRTTYCQNDGCYLTHWSNTKHLNFGKGSHPKFCPPQQELGQYLGLIGSGLVPPVGSLGNGTGNTAGQAEHWEAGWWGDEMMRVANVNDWHFSKAAVAWYVGMHRLAVYYAALAQIDRRNWARALHYEANALHSLTDLFAFGHVVTNRDRTAFGIMKGKKLLPYPAFQWMEQVLRVGGGVRDGEGEVLLEPTLPETVDTQHNQDEQLLSYVGSWGRYADFERRFHDEFNRTGAYVYNLNGQRFRIFGDGKLRDSDPETIRIIAGAVRTSVEDLFRARGELQSGPAVKKIERIRKSGTAYLGALKYVPVFVDADYNGYFSGSWALYAKFVNEVSGANKAMKDLDRCRIPYLWGKTYRWPPVRRPCTTW